MDEMQEFLRALKYHRLTSQQRKTLRGQALAGNLPAAKAGLHRIVKRGFQHDYSNAAGDETRTGGI